MLKSVQPVTKKPPDKSGGFWCSWYIQRLWEPKVPGSNPGAPTGKTEAEKWCMLPLLGECHGIVTLRWAIGYGPAHSLPNVLLVYNELGASFRYRRTHADLSTCTPSTSCHRVVAGGVQTAAAIARNHALNELKAFLQQERPYPWELLHHHGDWLGERSAMGRRVYMETGLARRGPGPAVREGGGLSAEDHDVTRRRYGTTI